MRTTIADLMGVAVFLLVWILLFVFDRTIWALPLIFIFTFMLAGLSEFMHQGVHGNLCGRNRKWNDRLGRITAALVGVDFRTYRAFHLAHHRLANTEYDPEREVYASPSYVESIKDWRTLSHTEKLLRFPSMSSLFGGAIAEKLTGDEPLVRIFGVGVPVMIAILALCFGNSLIDIAFKVLCVWYLPLFLFQKIDLFLAQSEHYGIAVTSAADRERQYHESWDLQLPFIIELLVLRRNIHAGHHRDPGIHWSMMQSAGDERSLPLFAYLCTWWKDGPRTF